MDDIPEIQVSGNVEDAANNASAWPTGHLQHTSIAGDSAASFSTTISHGGDIHKILIHTSRRRGSGGFAVVFEADMISPGGRIQAVVVKTLNSLLTEEDQMLLDREVTGWQSLSHSRILPFYGTCKWGIQQVGLVSPLAPNGNMKDFIMKNPEKNRLSLLQQVAEALNYLHVSAGLVHGDLKCTNVLISADESVLVADFGLSTFIERRETPTATNIRIRNTAAFAAPELFSDSAFDDISRDSTSGGLRAYAQKPRSKTTHSDIFAFGSLIYEAYSCEEPWRGRDAFTVIFKVAYSGETPPRHVNNPFAVPLSDHLWDLCLRCWKKEPSQRPDCGAILDAIRTM